MLEHLLRRISKCRSIMTSSTLESQNMIFFLSGSLFALVIFFLSIYQIDLLSITHRMMLLSIVLFVTSTSMTVLSTSVKCTLTLIAFNFLASSGKILYTSIVFESILKGPVGNTIDNIEKVFDSHKCQNEMMRDLGNRMTSDASVKSRIFQHIKKSSQDLSRNENELINAIEIFDNELNNDLNKSNSDKERKTSFSNQKKSNANGHDNQYHKKQFERCLMMIGSGEHHCIEGVRAQRFRDVDCSKKECSLDDYNQTKLITECYISKFHPFKGVSNTTICNQSINVNDSTNSLAAAQHVYYLKRRFNKKDEFELKRTLKHRQSILSNKENLINMEIDIQRLNSTILSTSKYVSIAASLARILSNFGFSLVLWNSFKYQWKYLSHIKFDNSYCTSYFRKIDSKQKRRLLPLKKTERSFIHYPLQFHISAYQKPLFKLTLILQSTLVVTLIVSLAIDYIVYDFLDILREYFVIDYSRQIQTEMTMNVLSHGFLSRMIHELIDANKLNRKKTVHHYVNTESCVPKITRFEIDEFVKLVLQVGLLILLTLAEVYLKRFNRPICALIYREREKKRALWLYNNILKKRKEMIASKYTIFFKLRNVLSHSHYECQNGTRIIQIMKQKCVLLAYLLNFLDMRSKCCIFCNQALNRFIVECQTCSILYCKNCWLDLEEKCLGCETVYNNDICENDED